VCYYSNFLRTIVFDGCYVESVLERFRVDYFWILGMRVRTVVSQVYTYQMLSNYRLDDYH
jgi:hypothetical protein